MALIEQKIVKEVRLEKAAGQVRLVVDNVILRDGEQIASTEGNEVYTQETAAELRLVQNGNTYADLMGW